MDGKYRTAVWSLQFKWIKKQSKSEYNREFNKLNAEFNRDINNVDELFNSRRIFFHYRNHLHFLVDSFSDYVSYSEKYSLLLNISCHYVNYLSIILSIYDFNIFPIGWPKLIEAILSTGKAWVQLAKNSVRKSFLVGILPSWAKRQSKRSKEQFRLIWRYKVLVLHIVFEPLLWSLF